MSFFNTILEKLGLRKSTPASTSVAAPPKPAAPAAKPIGGVSTGAGAKPAIDKGEKDNVDSLKTTTPTSKAISEVDVVKQLEKLSVGSGLDWKVSIVDLLKLLDIDSSREARNELAVELGCPADLMHDSAKMNTWLHKTVLKKIAENGGNIPQSLLD